MSFSPERVRFDADLMWVDISDGRTIGVPLLWFPRLLKATPEQRQAFELSRRGIHWDEIDEDILVEALFQGQSDQTRRKVAAA
jgi:hypothetical protein